MSGQGFGQQQSDRIAELRQKMFQLQHAMQTGVAVKMNFEQDETTPKHLRVGVNMAMIESGTLAGLLLSKGVFTEEEYYTALIEGLEHEIEMYKAFLAQRGITAELL